MQRIPETSIDVLIHEHVSGGGLAGDDLPESWAVEGSAMRRTLAGDFASLPGVRVAMTLDARLPDEPGPWTIIRIGPGDVETILPSLAARSGWTLPIAPETGGVLRDLVVSLTEAGARCLSSSPSAIDLTADKGRLAAHLSDPSRDIPHPSTRLVRPRDGLPAFGPYPAVLKPVDGAGSVDTVLVEGPDDPMIAQFGTEFGLLQPVIPGEPRSATFLIVPGGLVRLVGVARQGIDASDRRFTYRGGTILGESLGLDHPARRAVACVPGLQGLVGVDYLHNPATGRACVLEINPRPTTSCVGLIASLGPGRLAGAWLRALTGPDDPDKGDFLLKHAPISFRADGRIGGPSRQVLR